MSVSSSFKCISLVMLLAGCAVAVDESGTDPAAAEQEVVRGQVDNGHPQVVALMIPNVDGTETSCSAVLYSKRTLLTAAHCVQNAALVLAYHGNDYFGQFDQLSLDPSTWKNWAMSVDFKTHPSWNPTTLNADIAYIHLDRDLPFAPLPLAPNAIAAALVGQPVQIVGYGGIATDSTGTQPVGMKVKRQGTSIYRGSPPASPLPPHPHPGLGDKKIRDQLMQLDGRAPLANMCLGDSGSPSLMTFGGQQYITGIASWTGDFCRDFAYYVRTHSFTEFLADGIRTAPR